MNKNIYTAVLLLSLTQNMSAVGWWDLLFGSQHSGYGNNDTYYNQPRVETFSRMEMSSYVRQICRAFGYQLSTYEVSHLEELIIRAITNDQTCYHNGRNAGYIKEKIDQYINSGILEYIEEYAYNYAYKKLNNQKRARALAESMRNNALALISQSNTIPAAKVAQYIGSALYKAVEYEMATQSHSHYPQQYNNPPAYNPEYTQQYYAPEKPSSYQQKPSQSSYAPQTQSAFVTYPSDDCCICMESFSDVKRIFLRPCGHDICMTCAYVWFLDNSNKTCPQCRTVVSLPDLEAALAQ